MKTATHSRISPIPWASLLLPLLAFACSAESYSSTPDDTRLLLRVLDDTTGELIPARVLLFDEADQPLRIGHRDLYGETRQSLGFCLLADGAVGTWDGISLAYGSADLSVGIADCDGSPAIPHGRYRVWAWRGIEYEIFEAEINLEAGRGDVLVELPLERVFDPVGTLAADLHVHAENSNDSLVPDWVRVITQAAAGVQVIANTEHNHHSDFSDAIDKLGMAHLITSIAGNEAGTNVAHFGVYPVKIRPELPRGGALSDAEIDEMSVRELMQYHRAVPQQPFIQVNHPRLRWAALFDGAGWDGLSWPPPFPVEFDAVELSSWTAFNADGDRRHDEAVQDLYTFWENGVFVTAVGNSDTHHLNYILDATTRTYVHVDDPIVTPFDQDAFIDALRASRAVATTGPWLDVTVRARDGERAGPGETLIAEDGHIIIDIDVKQASFSRADRLRVVLGGQIIETIAMPPAARSFTWSTELNVGTEPTWIGVDVSGDKPLPVELTGTYQIDRGRPGMVPFAIINPIHIGERVSRHSPPLPLGPDLPMSSPDHAHEGCAH